MPAGTRAPQSAVERIRASQRSSQANKRCADCIERGPTYICLDFHTFVCQTCSGIHREFGHKIKGISLSEWTIGEVDAIEKGGNERAAQTWLARWTSSEFEEPDNSDMDRVREFIKSKYVDKRWFSQQPRREVAGATAPSQQEAAAVVKPPAQSVAAPSPPPTAPAVVLVKQVPIGDLLSDGCDPVFDAPPPSAPKAPQPSTQEALIKPALATSVPQLPSDANAGWTADFGSVPPGKIGGPADGLIDLNIVDTAAQDAATAGGLLMGDVGFGASWDTPCMVSSPIKAAPLVGFQEDNDGDPMAKSPVAEPAEEPAPLAADPPMSIEPDSAPQHQDEAELPPCAARDTAEGGMATLGDQLREAVLSGNTGDLNKLFQQCSQQQPQRKRPADLESRFAAFAAFDELGPGGGGGGPAAAASTAPSAAQDVASAVATTGPQQFFIGGDDTPYSPPKHGGDFFFNSPTKGVASSGLPKQLTAAAPTTKVEAGAPMTPEQLAQLQQLEQLMPKKLGMMSPQQLEQLNPQELLQMQMMISRALQVRSQGPPQPQQPQQPNAAWMPKLGDTSASGVVPVAGAGAAGGAASAPFDAIAEPEAPPKEFGDLIAEFQKKNPIAGFGAKG